jgi:hypothetical protein
MRSAAIGLVAIFTVAFFAASRTAHSDSTNPLPVPGYEAARDLRTFLLQCAFCSELARWRGGADVEPYQAGRSREGWASGAGLRLKAATPFRTS